MARIKIEIPDRVHFSTELDIRVGDLNYGDHLGNEQLLLYAQEARVRFFKGIGLSEFDIGGTGIIQSDAAIVYLSEGNLGDRIRIDLTIQELGASSFDIVCYMLNTSSGRPLGIVKTGMVCYNYDEAKVKRVPDSFRKRFTEEQG